MSIWEPAARSVVVAGVPGTEGVDCQGSSREPNQCVHVSFRLESLKPVGKLRLHTLEQELMLRVGFLLPLGDFTLAPKAITFSGFCTEDVAMNKRAPAIRAFLSSQGGLYIVKDEKKWWVML